jgi:hypothetical protein
MVGHVEVDDPASTMGEGDEDGESRKWPLSRLGAISPCAYRNVMILIFIGKKILSLTFI